MKVISRMLVGSLLVVPILSLVVGRSAHSQSASAARPSPLSGGVLMAQAIRSGAVQPIGQAATGPFGPESLTCSPAPCVLPSVQASGGNGPMPVNEDPIVANPRNGMQLLTGGNDFNCASVQGFFASSNGGTTWNHTCMNTVNGLVGFGDPGVGYDRNNVAYITGLDGTSSATNLRVVFEKSTNNGTTWGAPKTAVTPLFAGGASDKDWLQIDINANSPHLNCLYISTTQFDATFAHDTIAVAHSCDGGKTWTDKQVDTTQTLTQEVDQFSDLAIGKDGTVYVSWMRCPPTGPVGDCGGTTANMMFSKSTDGGNTWSAAVVMATVRLTPDICSGFYGCVPNTGERVSNIPAIDIDNSTGTHAGNLYAVMYNWTGTQMQVGVVTSTTGGATWGAPVRVAPRAKNDEFFPWLTVNANGIVGVTWLDRRNDPANISYETFAALSMTGGTSFGSNKQLATALSNPNNDGFGGTFMGDYTGNYWAGNTLYASWMDSRSAVNMQDEVGGFLQ